MRLAGISLRHKLACRGGIFSASIRRLAVSEDLAAQAAVKQRMLRIRAAWHSCSLSHHRV